MLSVEFACGWAAAAVVAKNAMERTDNRKSNSELAADPTNAPISCSPGAETRKNGGKDKC